MEKGYTVWIEDFPNITWKGVRFGDSIFKVDQRGSLHVYVWNGSNYSTLVAIYPDKTWKRLELIENLER